MTESQKSVQQKIRDESYDSEYNINLAVMSVIAFCQGIIGISDLYFVLISSNHYAMTQQELIDMRFFIQIPWMIKPLWGICSDIFPIFQYRRKSYLLIFGLIGFITENILSAVYIKNKNIAFGLLFLQQLSIVFCNVIGEAVLVENSGLKFLINHVQISDEQIQVFATRNVTIFFGMKALGNLINSILQPYQGKQTFYITSFLTLIMSLMSFLLKERKIEEIQNLKTLQITTIYTFNQFKYFINQPSIYKPILFIFFFMATPSPATAMFYFYINGLRLDDNFFYNLKFAYSLTTIIAMIFYNIYLKHIPFKSIFSSSNICYFTVSLLSLVLITRVNEDYGISDYQFCMADNILMQVVSQINTIPVLVLACKMCPINIEASMYSILMSAINLGGILSQHFGLLLTQYLGIICLIIQSLGVSTNNFDNLWVLVLATNFASQLPMPFIGAVSEEEVVNCQRVSFAMTRMLQIKDMQKNSINHEDDEQNLLINGDDQILID